jgi:hypothetical protein
MTSALPAGSSLDTGGVPPLEALFDKGWPASEIHFLPHRTRRLLKPYLKMMVEAFLIRSINCG